MLSINDLKPGSLFKFQEQAFEVTAAKHVKVARGGATLQLKMRNLETGATLERNFKGGDSFEEIDLKKEKSNFLYTKGDDYHFMNSTDFNQFSLNHEQLGPQTGLLKEAQEVTAVFIDGRVVKIELPPKVELEVAEAAPGVKGDTAQGSVTKPVTLETGLVIQAPLFVKQGDIIRINTEKLEYVERAS
jgi:elongation factor P